MSNLYQCDDGSRRLLDVLTNNLSVHDLDGAKACLFTAPTSVDHTTALGSITEATFPGYARITLSAGNWPAASVSSHVAGSTYSTALTWTCTGGGAAQQVYGIYILDSTGTYLLYIATFAGAPYQMLNNGDQIQDTPTIQQESIY